MTQRAFIVALGSVAVWPLAACAPVAMGPTTYFADPGQYEYFSCALLAERRKYWADRELPNFDFSWTRRSKCQVERW